MRERNSKKKHSISWQNGCLCVYDSESGTEPSNACAYWF